MAHIFNLTPKERKQRQIDRLNEEPGELDDGYDCKLCKNRGMIFHMTEEKCPDGSTYYGETSKPCQCVAIRANIRRMKKSGLEKIVRDCTFEKYETPEEWQKSIKAAAEKFVAEVHELKNKWFFMGGAIGCGKTHLCTAISREFLLQGKEVRYMLWVDESKKIKACANDEAKRLQLIEPIKNAEVLYIDDLFKVPRDMSGNVMQYPTAADLSLAYEIINYRAGNPDLITIISCEWYVSEIQMLDSGTGSRIYDKTKPNAINISRDEKRNYRIRDMNIV